jgi:hypothetical protein
MTTKEVTVEREVTETKTDTEKLKLCNGCAEEISDEDDSIRVTRVIGADWSMHFCTDCLKELDIDDQFKDVYTESQIDEYHFPSDDDSTSVGNDIVDHCETIYDCIWAGLGLSVVSYIASAYLSIQLDLITHEVFVATNIVFGTYLLILYKIGTHVYDIKYPE